MNRKIGSLNMELRNETELREPEGIGGGEIIAQRRISSTPYFVESAFSVRLRKMHAPPH
jgi:hypothetical protein